MQTPALPGPSLRSEPPSRGAARADAAFALLVVLGLAAAASLYVLFPSLLALLIFSSLVAYALLPVVDWLEQRGLARTLAVLLVGVGGAGLLALGASLLIPALVAELERMPTAIGHTVAEVSARWEQLSQRLPAPLARSLEQGVAALERGVRSYRPGSEALSSYAASAATAATAVASGLVLVPVFVFLMLRGYHPFVAGLGQLVPPRWRPQFFARAREADRVLSGFIRGQLLVALTLAVLYCTAFSLIGVPLAILVGILAGFGELIPFVGNAIALTLGALLALASGQPTGALWVVGAYAAIQTLQGSLISPYVMGKRVHLSPVSVIIALAIGGELLGLIGLLVAVPATALLKVAARAAVSAYQRSAFFRGGERH